MSQPSWKNDADRQSSAWVDVDDGVAGVTDASTSRPSAEPPSSAEDKVQHHVADLLLVSALLASMSEGAVRERENRIRRIMEAIDVSASLPPSRVRIVRWSSALAVAACLMIVVTITCIQFGRNSLANEVLLAVHEASLQTADRIYAIRRVLPTGPDHGLPHPRLYLRGRDGFVITCGDVVLGRHADQFWLVTAHQQVSLSDDFHWIDAGSTGDETSLRIMQELSLESRHVPLMQLPSVAELMQHDYEVEWTRGHLHHRTVDVLVGQRQSARPELPVTIRLWSDIDSRVIQRAELSWGRSNAIILEIEPAEPVPANWYSYRAHCNGEPKVRRITSGS